MFTSLEHFKKSWANESESTLKVLRALTDASLGQAVGPDDRTLGRIAWHLTTTIREMMDRTGLKLAGPGAEAPLPGSANAIVEAYEKASGSLPEALGAWNDASSAGQGRDVWPVVEAGPHAARLGRPPGPSSRTDDRAHAPGRAQGSRRLWSGAGRVADHGNVRPRDLSVIYPIRVIDGARVTGVASPPNGAGMRQGTAGTVAGQPLSRREWFARPTRHTRPEPLASSGPEEAGHWIHVHRPAMACRFEITLPGEDGRHLAAAREALDEVDRLEAVLTRLPRHERGGGAQPIGRLETPVAVGPELASCSFSSASPPRRHRRRVRRRRRRR